MHTHVVGRSGMGLSVLEWSMTKGFAEHIFNAGVALREHSFLVVVLHDRGRVY